MKTKQVIVIRRDLKMRRGKECAQVAHASMMWLTNRIRARKDLLRVSAHEALDFSDAEREWVYGLFTKIVCQVTSEAALRMVHDAAFAAGLTAMFVTDSGATEFAGVPTVTACAIGPDDATKVDAVCGHLTLY